MSIADDPSSWTSPVRDNGGLAKKLKSDLKPFDAVNNYDDRLDYQMLRQRLIAVKKALGAYSSNRARDLVDSIQATLDSTPKHGASE